MALTTDPFLVVLMVLSTVMAAAYVITSILYDLHYIFLLRSPTPADNLFRAVKAGLSVIILLLLCLLYVK